MIVARIVNEDQDVITPDYEIIENGNDLRLRIAVPGLVKEEVKVTTVGNQLFIETANPRNLLKDAVRLSGKYLSPQFSMEFAIDTSVTIGSPFLEYGVLTIPMVVNPEIMMSERNYSVREISKADTVHPNGTDDWVYASSIDY
jgi:HSP20 family molecular chaperone IbpA